MSQEARFDLSCPRPQGSADCVLLGHGGGGQLSHELIQKHIRPLYAGDEPLHDSAVFVASSSRLAFTTDSFVVHPLFFPGGDIGSLAVYGSLNDLAMAGARLEFLSLALIIEEGLNLAILDRILHSIREACLACDVRCVTGDTKVVERGKGDGLFINTSGIGSLRDGVCIHPSRLRPGDAILVSGDLGRHGTAILCARNPGRLQCEVTSDVGPLFPMVRDLLEAGVDLHCLRDLTRGGLAASLHELVQASQLAAIIDEEKVPVDAAVLACCEVLGLDPLSLANEGRFVAMLPEADVARALPIMARFSGGNRAARIGCMMPEPRSQVLLKSGWGTLRILPMPSGELLPRIC